MTYKFSYKESPYIVVPAVWGSREPIVRGNIFLIVGYLLFLALVYYHGTTFWQILSISFVLTQFLTFLPPECSGLFPKHLIYSLIILLHRNLWMGCYASIEQVLGPPFDKMSHTVTVQQACQIQKSDNRNWINQWNVSVGVWTQLENVMPSNVAAGADSNTFITKPIILEIYT